MPELYDLEDDALEERLAVHPAATDAQPGQAMP